MQHKNVTIKTENDLRNFIRTAIKEANRSQLYRQTLREKEMQNTQAAAAPTPPEGNKPAEQPAGNNAPAPPQEDDKEAMKKGNIAYEDIVDKLNTIRAGKSFKDSAIAGGMKQYIDGLDAAEKTALFAFLKGMAQIVTGEVPDAGAIQPDTSPADVSMEKSNVGDVKKVQIKPVVIKGTPSQKNPGKNAEDTTGPAPVTPKKR